MSDFISVREAMPALHSLVEYKYESGHTGHSRLILATEKGDNDKTPFLFWAGLNGDSTKWPATLTHWRYVEEDKELRDKETKEWQDSLSHSRHSDSINPDELSE